uniref:Secreted protein n=1 Tax=Ixodes ricinus TaxID=34613 RepID=A0A6B0UTT6_IXORI
MGAGVLYVCWLSALRAFRSTLGRVVGSEGPPRVSSDSCGGLFGLFVHIAWSWGGGRGCRAVAHCPCGCHRCLRLASVLSALAGIGVVAPSVLSGHQAILHEVNFFSLYGYDAFILFSHLYAVVSLVSFKSAWKRDIYVGLS